MKSQNVLATTVLAAALFTAAVIPTNSALAQNATPAEATVVTKATDPAMQSQMEKLIDAIKSNDRTAFISNGTDEMKAAMTPQVIQGIHDQLNPRLAGGYSTTYLTDMKKGPYKVYVWKISFKDGSDDDLIQMTILNGKLAGFFIQ